MATVTAFDAKTRFGELLDRVVGGEEIIITRHDKPVARIVPEGRKSLAEFSAAVDALAALRSRILERGEGKLSDTETREAILEGRR
jgi:prevent-host-death family protein